MLETSPDYPRACTIRVSATSVPVFRLTTSLSDLTEKHENLLVSGKIKDVAGESSSNVMFGSSLRSSGLATRYSPWKHTTRLSHSGVIPFGGLTKEVSVVLLSFTGFPGVTRDSNLVDSASSIRLSQRLSHACLSINKSIL